jgi:hypothetical protein
VHGVQGEPHDLEVAVERERRAQVCLAHRLEAGAVDQAQRAAPCGEERGRGGAVGVLLLAAAVRVPPAARRPFDADRIPTPEPAVYLDLARRP